MSGFRDHFSRQAAAYARARPDYPDALFDALAAAAPGRGLVWDVGTGSGQAATALARRFDRVVATDASGAQLRHAVRTARVDYVAARAEAAPLADGVADVVTVAQALHWFEPAGFHAEVRRVARRGGLIAAWSYGDARLDDGPADALLAAFNREVVGPDWPAERAYVGEGLRALPVPHAPVDIDAPAAIERRWTADELLAYVASWSATVRHATRTGTDPLPALAAPLRARLGTRRVTVRWPLVVRAGRVEPSPDA